MLLQQINFRPQQAHDACPSGVNFKTRLKDDATKDEASCGSGAQPTMPSLGHSADAPNADFQHCAAAKPKSTAPALLCKRLELDSTTLHELLIHWC